MRKATILSILACLFVLLNFNALSAQSNEVPFDDMPPAGEFGKCYAKCKAPDVYETVTERVLVKEETKKYKVIPAKFDSKREKVLVKEARVDYKVIPATYKTISEKVMVTPEKRIQKTIPATYRTDTRRVEVSPARGEWVRKLKDPNCFSDNPEDCFIMCYEEIPAVYRTEKYQVLVSDAKTVEEVIPAKYKTVTKRVIDQPARTVEVPVDAVYDYVNTTVVVADEKVLEEKIPAEYKTVSSRKLVKKGGYSVWTEILCADQTNSSIIRQLQRALKAEGYHVGPVDGVLGKQTQEAIKKYQEDKGLPIGNMNIKTLESLDLDWKGRLTSN